MNQTETLSLNYPGEHLGCRSYTPPAAAPFAIRHIPAGEPLELSAADNHLLMFTRGSCTARCGRFAPVEFHAAEMAVVAAGAAFKATAGEPLRLIDLRFDKPAGCCEKMVIRSYANVRTHPGCDFTPTPMRAPLPAFCAMLEATLGGGLSCSHFHDIKQQELMFYLRAYYTKEEIARLFHPVIDRHMDFREFIRQNHDRVDSLDELITMSNMSRRTFFRRFKADFGMTAYQWMLKQTAGAIAGEFARGGATPGEIAEKMGFASASNFCNFCKRTLGLSPTELMKKHSPQTPSAARSDD